MGFKNPPILLVLLWFVVVTVLAVVLLGLCGAMNESSEAYDRFLALPEVKALCGDSCVGSLWHAGCAVGITSGLLAMLAALFSLVWLIFVNMATFSVKLTLILLYGLLSVLAFTSAILLAVSAGDLSDVTAIRRLLSFYGVHVPKSELAAAAAFAFFLFVGCVGAIYLSYASVQREGERASLTQRMRNADELKTRDLESDSEPIAKKDYQDL